MKSWYQTTEQIEAIIATGKPIEIVSGEGENGTREAYTGAKTVRAIKARLTRERCHGDRWARVDTDDGMALYGLI
jgi:hypothetical protein